MANSNMQEQQSDQVHQVDSLRQSPDQFQTPSSSPFRIALRPRHRPITSTNYQHASGGLVPYTSRRRHGRLTSALLGMVDSIEGHLLEFNGQGNVGSAATHDVPRLHRADGGLGRASEELEEGHNNLELNQEESSLAMAREFLSRLLMIWLVLSFCVYFYFELVRILGFYN